MPKPWKWSEEDYSEMRNILEAEPSNDAEATAQAEVAQMVTQYERYHSLSEDQQALWRNGHEPAGPATPRLPNRTQDEEAGTEVSFEPEHSRPDGVGELFKRALTAGIPRDPQLWQEPSRQAVIREVMRQANSGELWGKPVPFTEEMAAHYFEGQPPKLQAQFEAEFADRAWRDEVERAQEQGYSVKRARFSDVGPVEKYGHAANDMMKSAALGFADTASLGLSDEVMPDELRARLDEVRAQNPTSEKLGMIGGVLAPIGAPGLAARGSGALLNVGKGGLASRMARSGGAGAIGAGATQGLESVIAGEDPEQVLEAVGGVLPLGFFGGALGEAAGSGIRRMREQRLMATEHGANIVDLERSGGKTRFLFAPKPSERSQAAMRRSLEKGVPRQAEDFLADDATYDAIASTASRKRALDALHGNENRAFYAKDANNRGSFKPAFRSVVDVMKSRTDETGELLPFLSRVREASALMGKQLSRRASLIDDAERSRVLQNPNRDVLSVDEARAMGIDIEDIVARHLMPKEYSKGGLRLVKQKAAEAGITLDVPPGMSFEIDLGNFTAKQTDDMLAELDDVMDQAAVRGSSAPYLRQIAQGMRRTRDTYGLGWGAIKARHHNQRVELENDKVRMGLQPETKLNPADARVYDPVKRSIMTHTQKGRSDTREALERATAHDPVAAESLRAVTGTTAYKNLMNQMEPGQSGGLLNSAFRQARLRIADPTSKALGQPAMTQIRGIIDSLPSDARDLLNNYISGQFQMTGGALGTKASQALDTTPEMTAKQREELRKPRGQWRGVKPRGPEPEPEGPPTEDEWYKRMFKALVDLAGD